MQISICTKSDFDQILENFGEFWGNDGSERLLKLKTLHHPMLLYELGDNAFVIKDNNKVAAYLFGLFSNVEAHAYVHFIATHRDYQRRGLATLLYKHFIDKARQNNCKYIKATTSVDNVASRNFHMSIGMSLLGKDEIEGIRVVKDYAGPGQDRIVFKKILSVP